MCLMYPIDSVVYKKITEMALPFMQTLKFKKVSSMNIENCLVGPNFGDTHLMKNYPDLLKIWNIDGADK